MLVEKQNLKKISQQHCMSSPSIINLKPTSSATETDQLSYPNNDTSKPYPSVQTGSI